MLQKNKPWELCTEENYPENDNQAVIAVLACDRWRYYLYDSCPYGWNVLCANKAYVQFLTEPKTDEKNSD